MPNGKVMTMLLIVGYIKKTLYKMSQYFPKPYRSFGGLSKLIYLIMQQKLT